MIWDMKPIRSILSNLMMRCEMTVRHMIEKYRTNCIVEIRQNNFKVMEFNSEDYQMVKDELIDSEVSNWFVDQTGRLLATRDRVVIDIC